jgi:hypothetical protein
MKSDIRYIILEDGRGEIQKKLNQWLSTGYDVNVEQFVCTSVKSEWAIPKYTAVIRRWKV